MTRTRMTKLLKCRYPIILPGMSWISNPELVAAVSNAGGVGILATGPLSADETRASIRRIRELTPHTFGVGATLLMPGALENARVAIDERVPLLNVSLGKAPQLADGVHAYGGTVLATVTNAAHARAALEAGADALLVTGCEAAAHGSDVGTAALVPAIALEFPRVPLAAAGGIASGAGLAAALALGADAVAMGSRFAASAESPLSRPAKDAICAASAFDTVRGSGFDGIPARVLRTELSQRLMDRPPSVPVVVWRALLAARSFNIPLRRVLPGLATQWNRMLAVAQFGAATKALEAATVHGDMDRGVQFVGQSQGMIHEHEITVEDIVQTIMKDALQASHRARHMLMESEQQTQDEEDPR